MWGVSCAIGRERLQRESQRAAEIRPHKGEPRRGRDGNPALHTLYCFGIRIAAMPPQKNGGIFRRMRQ